MTPTLVAMLAVAAVGAVPGLIILIARRHLPGSGADTALLDYVREPIIAAGLVIWWGVLLALAGGLAAAW